jgi:hypothetical protein
MTDDDEMKELERRMSAKLFGSVATREPVVENRKLRGSAWPNRAKGFVEVIRIEAANHPEDERFDIIRVFLGGNRIKIRSGVFRDEVDAALRPYVADKLDIKWLA